MTKSKTEKENYFGYLIIEIIMLLVIIFLGIGFFIFFFSMKMENLDFYIEHPLLYGLLCLAPALFGVGYLIKHRNRNYIVGYLFNDNSQTLSINYRNIVSKNIKQLSISYPDLHIHTFKEIKILFNQTYKGVSITGTNKTKRLDFVTNNFIWEAQAREKRFFIDKINHVTSQYF